MAAWPLGQVLIGVASALDFDMDIVFAAGCDPHSFSAGQAVPQDLRVLPRHIPTLERDRYIISGHDCRQCERAVAVALVPAIKSFSVTVRNQNYHRAALRLAFI